MALATLKKKPAPAKPAAKPKPMPVSPMLAAPVGMQTKLEVGPVGDRFEQEADRVAESVMRMPNPAMPITAAPLQISRKCAVCEREEEDERLQKKTDGPVGTSLGAAPASVHDALRSPGQPLDASTRGYFEPRFGQEFCNVRVHTGMTAARSARDVSAHAYTVGQNIVFAAGRFAPGTQTGRRLIAHELTHVVQNFPGGAASVIRRTPGAGAYEIISPIWNVGGRDIVIVQMKADGRAFFFYRRTGLGSKGAFESTAPSGGKWVPFEGFEEVEKIVGTKGGTTYRLHKEPYYYSPAVKEGQVAPGYGTQTNKDIAQWLDNELPPGKVAGKAANWRDVQNQLSKYKARNLPSPGTEAPPKARTVSGEIGGGSTPTGGGAGGEITTESVPPAATTPKPTSAVEPHLGGTPTPKLVPEPKPGFFRTRLNVAKAGIAEGLEAAFSPEGIAAVIPDVILAIADRVAAREAIKAIQIKFIKEGFAKGFAAGVVGWSQEEVNLNLKNLVTPFRVQGLEDPAGFLTRDYILKLAEAYENYAVDVGFQFSSSKNSKWKKDILVKGLAGLADNDYHFTGDPEVYLFEYEFIDKLAWVLRTTTNPMVARAIRFR
jgi:Domain of unknown function (DUF4157)